MRSLQARLALSAVLAATLFTPLAACNYAAYFVRDTRAPMDALEFRMDPQARRDCLIVLMPGMGDTPDSYIDNGFVEDALRSSRRCDLLGVDAHFGYYQNGTLRDRLAQDVFAIAGARGYQEIWVVGISMGGLGALMAAQTHAEQVTGVVLLAPFMGDPEVVRSVRDAGGVAEWDAPEDADPRDDDEYGEALWAWLQGYATHPERMPQLYIGVGEEDRLRSGAGLLAEVLPEARHGEAPGGHNWVTWRILWRRLLASPPWDPRGVPRIDH